MGGKNKLNHLSFILKSSNDFLQCLPFELHFTPVILDYPLFSCHTGVLSISFSGIWSFTCLLHFNVIDSPHFIFCVEGLLVLEDSTKAWDRLKHSISTTTSSQTSNRINYSSWPDVEWRGADQTMNYVIHFYLGSSGLFSYHFTFLPGFIRMESQFESNSKLSHQCKL